MITITPSTDSVKFVFDGNQYYLNDGSISYPLNSLSMTIDQSDVITFKSQSGDIVLGCPLEQLGKTKEEMEELYESSFVGGAGVTPEDVEELIEEAVSGKQDTSGMTAYTLTSTTDALNTVVTAHTANTTIHVTAADKASWDAKVDQADLEEAVSGKADTNDVNEALEVASRAMHELKDGKQDTSGMTAYTLTSTTDELSGTVTAHTANTTIHVSASDRANWDGAVTALGGNKIVALTQAQYDALTVKDAHTLYIITE